MVNIQGLDHIVLRTHCLKAMLDFYQGVLGCSIEREQPAFHLTQLRAGDSLIDLVEVSEGEVQAGRNMEHFCLRVKGFDAAKLKAYFEGKGISVNRLGTRYGAQGMGESFYITDPQGNEVELCAVKHS